MASHAGSGSSDDEEDFGPLLPGMQPAPPHATEAPKEDAEAPPLKRERQDATPPTPPPPPPVPHLSDEDQAKEAWERYTRVGLPSAALYERSFAHTTLQDTYDALAAEPKASAHNQGSSGKSSSSSGAAAVDAPVAASRTVHDVCVYEDSLGALIATIDAAGVVRVWRKLPRGVFFITELDKIFKPARSTASGRGTDDAASAAALQSMEEEEGLSGCHRTYWAHAHAALQALLFVCVEEDVVDRMEVEHLQASPAASARNVRVHLRQMNPITYTVEQRHSFSFSAPLLSVAALSARETAQHKAHEAAAAESHAHASPYALAYTRRPFFLTHQYQPHIAFFLSMPATTTAAAAAGGGGGSGVIVCPCFPSAMSGNSRSSLGVHYAPVRLSVANPVVQCVQQSVGIERTGTAPCVLVDAAGILDYCTIESTNNSNNSTSSSSTGNSSGMAASTEIPSPTATICSGWTLRVVAGLAAAPPNSREVRLWREWIRFDRRQRTGFFRLLRDAQQTLNALHDSRKIHANSSDGAAVTEWEAGAVDDVQVVPCAVRLTADGRCVAVWSVRLLRSAEAAPARQSRIPSTERRYRLQVESCLHLFDFSSGACVGAHVDVMQSEVTLHQDISARVSDWVAYLQLRSRVLAVGMHLEDAGSASSFYLAVPELSIAQLLGDAAGTPPHTVGPTSGVCGRQIRVYQVVLRESGGAVIRRLEHGPGEWEALLRQPLAVGERDGPADLSDSLTVSSLRIHFAPHELAAQQLTDERGDRRVASAAGVACQALCRAPLLLVRRAVAPSQDLKNLIAASPLGAALGTEARKQLFLIPTSPSLPSTAAVAAAAAAAAEALFLTTSMEAGTTSLLVYSCELPLCATAIRRFLAHRPGVPSAASMDAGEGDGASDVESQAERQRLWKKLRQDLQRERDYACGSLLMTTVAPPASAHERGGDGTTLAATSAGAAGGGTAGVDADNQTKQHTEGETEGHTHAHRDKSTPTTAAKAATASAMKLSAPETRIFTLLQRVIPQLGAALSGEGGAVKLPVALVHIRGYGPIRVHLLPQLAPLAVENFTRLGRRHYYNRLTLHRIIPHVIVQGGCPRGDGTGGESAFEGGAPFKDEALDVFPFFSHTAEAEVCWLCMANAGPNTNGSQFFFTVPGGEAMPWLNGHHTVFGFAVDGLDVVRAISVAARDEEDKPLSPIVIERVDVLSG